MHVTIKSSVSVLLLASELLCLQINFIINIRISFIKLQFSSYKFIDENTNAKNFTEFSNYIRNVPIEGDEIIESFDVTSLYMNIPIIDTLNIIKGYVNNDDQFTRKAAICQDKFLDLVHLVLTTMGGHGRPSIFNHSKNLYAGL